MVTECDKWESLAGGLVSDLREFRRQVTEELAALLQSFDPPVSRILEAGCGSGLTGIGLLQRGFSVDLMDFSPAMLERAGEAAERYLPRDHPRPALHHADLFEATHESLEVEPFDCVFNAGVLEHYEEKDIVRLLRAMGRLSRRYVVALVPNSRCVAYRWWRWRRTHEGTWPYGHETPRATLADLTEQAGLEPLLEVPMAQLGALEMAREISPDSGDVLDWLLDDDLPDELSCYLICCVARVRGDDGAAEKSDPRDLLAAAQRRWIEDLRSAQRRWTLSLANKKRETGRAEQRLSALQQEHREVIQRQRGEVERLHERLAAATEGKQQAEAKASRIEADLQAAESRLERGRQVLAETIGKIETDRKTAEVVHRLEAEKLRREYRAALVAARAETTAASLVARKRQAELGSKLKLLETDLNAIEETLGYRILGRLRRWRSRLLFLSATSQLRPTPRSLMAAVFCWPWRLLLPPSCRSVLDARISDPAVFHDSLRVFTEESQSWLDKGFEAVDTGRVTPREVQVSLIATVLDEEKSIVPWLRSIACQTRLPDELVVVDGGSSDGTVRALEEASPELPFEIRVLVEPGCNIARGRNVALGAARNEIVAVTDAGCELSPRWLQEIAAPFEHDEEVDGVIGWSEMHRESPTFCHRTSWLVVPSLEETNPRTLLPSSRSFAFRRVLGLRLGGYPEHLTKWAEDTLFSLNLTGIGAQWAFAPEAVTYWRGPSSWWKLLRLHRNYLLGNGEARIYQGTAGNTVREILTLTTLASLTAGLLLAGLESPAFPVAVVSGLLTAFYIWRADHTRWALDQRHRWKSWYRWSLRPILGCWLTGISETVGSLQGLYRSRRQIVRRVLDVDRETIVFLASHDWFWMKQRLGHLADVLRQRGLQVVFCPNNYVERTFGSLLPVPGDIILCNDLAALKRLRKPVFYSAAAGHYAGRRAAWQRQGRAIFDLIDTPVVTSSTEAEVVEAARRADLCFAVSEVLVEHLRQGAGVSPSLVPNGVDTDHWTPGDRPPPADLAPIVDGVSTLVGYMGALGWWIDFELLQAAARAQPQWRFVLVGPVLCEETFEDIRLLPSNVHHLGLKPHAELPAYLDSFTVGLIPFRLGEETCAADPVKLYEYAAMEVPIVSTDIPRCRNVDGVHIARSSEEFIACLDRAVAERQDPEARRALRKFALENTWDQRADVILRELGFAERYRRACASG